jgi:hypothetical protein
MAQQTVFGLRYQVQPLGELRALPRLVLLLGSYETEEQHIPAAGCVLRCGHVDSEMTRLHRPGQWSLDGDSKPQLEK